jgi:PAS domain S-box-containing protein
VSYDIHNGISNRISIRIAVNAYTGCVRCNVVIKGGYLPFPANSLQAHLHDKNNPGMVILESENIFRTIFETAGNPTSVLEPDGSVFLVNRAWEKLHGYSREEVEGRLKYVALLHEEDQAWFEKCLDSLSLHSGLILGDREARIVRKNGDVKNVLLTASIIPGTTKRLVSVADATLLKCTRDGLRTTRSLFKVLARRVGEAREEERHRIARELHDQLCQELVAIKIEAVSLAERLEDPPLVDRANSLVNLADKLTGTVRRISTNLRPDMLDRLGLAETVQWFAEDFERRTGISCPVDIDFRDNISVKESATAAYRIIREALTNTSLHAKATQVEVKIGKIGAKLVVVVADNGIGMDMNKVNDSTSLGLVGMRERAYVAGGNLVISSHPGRGTKVIAHLPLLEGIQCTTQQGSTATGE